MIWVFRLARVGGSRYYGFQPSLLERRFKPQRDTPVSFFWSLSVSLLGYDFPVRASTTRMQPIRDFFDPTPEEQIVVLGNLALIKKARSDFGLCPFAP